MRLFNKIVSFLLICGMYMVCFNYPNSVSASDESLEPNESNDVTKEFRQNQEEANKAYTAFFSHYYDEQKMSDKKSTGYCVNGVSKEILPDYFGGMYINKYGDLVFEVLSKYETDEFYESDIYNEILDTTKADAEHIVIRYVDNSYCDILIAMDKLLDLVATGTANGRNAITSIGINDSKNGIDVYFSFIPEKDYVDLVAKECGDIKVFVHDDCGTNEFETGIYPGEGVETSSTNKFSVAFPVTITEMGVNKSGFITCAHTFVGMTSANVYFLDGTSVGTFTNAYYNFGGSADAAFI